ncbi:oligoribonuclease [Shewanella glacialimarina]|uniref:oligoribonuclease n=1 Tax=Shewanella glacialimarina TaxID=2590884 RepID=UPI001CF7F4F1|nr:oligoribonuclease [Shewanella glacialimarina]UCX03559.1 oligoribonuclease [Shewanella glacialimarina]
MSPYFIFGDIETGGLNGRLDNGELGMEYYPILELAFILTDKDLNQIGEPLRVVVHHSDEVIATCNEWALDTHTASGLIDDVRASTVSLEQAELMVIDWLKGCGVTKYDFKSKQGVVFAGNSIMFDRSYIMCQMPILHEYMHYRQLDVSAIALAARAFNPELERKATSAKLYKHEALADIRESIEELRVYKQVLGGDSQSAYERFSDACRVFAKSLIKGLMP